MEWRSTKRGDTYWYKFNFNGQRIQKSAQTSNKEVAKQIEAAHRVRLAKGDAGIVERPAALVFKEFAPRFTKAIETLCANKPQTVDFYKRKLRALLKYEPIASTPLDLIEEAAIQAFQTGSPPSRIPPQEAFVRSQREPRAGHFAPAAASGAGVEGT